MPVKREKQIIAVYSEGAVSTGSLLHRLRQTYPAGAFDIRTIGTADITEKKILESGKIHALFMPGVQDDSRSYRDLVTLDGWNRIRAYIEEGGAVVGLCAGAYLATANFEYLNYANGELRKLYSPLDIFEGKAFGPIPQYTNTSGRPGHKFANHAVARLAFNEAAGYRGEGAACYALGPYLTLPPEIAARPDYKIIARYADVPGQPIAIASRRVGKGVAVFCGVVPEVSGADMPAIDQRLTYAAFNRDEDVAAGQAFAQALAAHEDGRRRTWEILVAEIGRRGVPRAAPPRPSA